MKWNWEGEEVLTTAEAEEKCDVEPGATRNEDLWYGIAIKSGRRNNVGK